MAEENFSQNGEYVLVFHVFTAGGKPMAPEGVSFSLVFHSVLGWFWLVFRSRFVGWLVPMATKKPPDGG